MQYTEHCVAIYAFADISIELRRFIWTNEWRRVLFIPFRSRCHVSFTKTMPQEATFGVRFWKSQEEWHRRVFRFSLPKWIAHLHPYGAVSRGKERAGDLRLGFSCWRHYSQDRHRPRAIAYTSTTILRLDFSDTSLWSTMRSKQHV